MNLSYSFLSPRDVWHLSEMSWWRHQMETFSAHWPFVMGNSPVTGEFPTQRSVTFSLICAWTNGWAKHRSAGDFRRHRAHYDATVMVTDISLRPDKTYKLQWTGLSWVKDGGLSFFGTKALPEPMMIYCIRPTPQSPQGTGPISHNTPFKTEMCTFLSLRVYCGIWDRCVVGFVRLVYWVLILKKSISLKKITLLSRVFIPA